MGASLVALSANDNLSALTASQRNKRLNILLYVTDDQGTNDAGCYGRKSIKTPGLDMLAREATMMTNGFCTAATCSPSRSVILTGQHCHATGQYGLQHGKHNFSTYDHIKSLPTLLQNAGYRTATTGKYHVAPEKVYHFQNYPPAGSPVQMAENCKQFISEDSNSPFFLYFCTNEPHRPFLRDGSDNISSEDVSIPSFLPDIPEVRKELAQYYMSVQRADRGLVKLIEILKETGKWDNTLIVYVSDNGVAFPGGAKTNLYEPGIKVPFVVRDPRSKVQGSICNAMVTCADITPTILDAANAASKDNKIHGRSFLSVLNQQNPTGWNDIYASQTFHEITMYYPMRAVRNRRYKLIYNIAHQLEFPMANDLWKSETRKAIEKQNLNYGKRTRQAYLHRPEFELYDIVNDPDELTNLAYNPKYKEIFEQLKQKIVNFQKKTNDPWYIRWQRQEDRYS